MRTYHETVQVRHIVKNVEGNLYLCVDAAECVAFHKKIRHQGRLICSNTHNIGRDTTFLQCSCAGEVMVNVSWDKDSNSYTAFQLAKQDKSLTASDL